MHKENRNKVYVRMAMDSALCMPRKIMSVKHFISMTYTLHCTGSKEMKVALFSYGRSLKN